MNDKLYFLYIFLIPNFCERLWLVTIFYENLQKSTTKQADVFHIILWKN